MVSRSKVMFKLKSDTSVTNIDVTLIYIYKFSCGKPSKASADSVNNQLNFFFYFSPKTFREMEIRCRFLLEQKLELSQILATKLQPKGPLKITNTGFMRDEKPAVSSYPLHKGFDFEKLEHISVLKEDEIMLLVKYEEHPDFLIKVEVGFSFYRYLHK